jgi:hypothetical protein
VSRSTFGRPVLAHPLRNVNFGVTLIGCGRWEDGLSAFTRE